MPGFSLSACVHDNNQAKSACARRVVGQLMPDVPAYTLEIPFFHTCVQTPALAAAAEAGKKCLTAMHRDDRET